MSEEDYLVSISAFVGFGPVRTKLLLNYFKTAKNVWLTTKHDLLNIGLKPALVNKFIEHRSKFDFSNYKKSLDQESICVLTIKDKRYPKNLKQINSAPFVLYVKGKLVNSDIRSVAIVGTRMMTGYGREIAQKFASELANFGITVVSGLALGVDAEAHKWALRSGGRTISILASGLDNITPITNRSLALEIIKGHGALISENPLGHTPMPFDFPVRDRLISGMAKAVIVIEGRKKSGTFHTVNAALDQGRPVFAVPGPITSPASEGPNYLIQNGAKLITKTRDVLDELDIEFKVDTELVEKVVPVSPEEEKLFSLLNSGSLHLDELVRISGVTTSEVSARLTIMEMKGLVKNLGGGVYKKI